MINFIRPTKDPKIDYDFKEFCLTNYPLYFVIEKQMRRCLFEHTNFIYKDMVLIEFEDICYLYPELIKNDLVFREVAKINHARFERVVRLKNRIQDMFNNFDNVYFITFTFNDDILNKTSEKSRRIYIRRFLKTHSKNYVANVDYGKNTEREHYHAIASICPVSKFLYPYGFCDYKKVFTKSESDKTRIAKYISKLTNHAIKKTASRSSLIYSRG